MTGLYALLVGVAMGVLIQRVRVSSPGVIAQNLRLENISIVKFMATTIAVVALVLGAIFAAVVTLLPRTFTSRKSA